MVKVSVFFPLLFPALSVALAVRVYVPVVPKVFEEADVSPEFFHGKPSFEVAPPSFLTALTLTLLVL